MGAVSLTASKAKNHATSGAHAGRLSRALRERRLDELEERVFRRLMPADEFDAAIVEPIQGEGGYVVPDAAFLPASAEICDRHGSSSSPTRSSRRRPTGKMWAIEHFGVEPDIVLAAKGIASGMPIGAMIARAELMTWGAGAHGSTYGGNPVALAALMETVALLEEGLIANAAERGDQGLRALRPLVEHFPNLVRDVRGKGLMIGIQLASAEIADAVQMQAFERGLLVLEAGDDCVRMSPPLVVTAEEMATAVRIFGEAVAHVAGHRAADVREVETAIRAGFVREETAASG